MDKEELSFPDPGGMGNEGAGPSLATRQEGRAVRSQGALAGCFSAYTLLRPYCARVAGSVQLLVL